MGVLKWVEEQPGAGRPLNTSVSAEVGYLPQFSPTTGQLWHHLPAVVAPSS
jgi:hypothetical protein